MNREICEHNVPIELSCDACLALSLQQPSYQELQAENELLSKRLKEKAAELHFVEECCDRNSVKNTKLREALERSVEHIEHEGHDCDYYHIPETGICRWCYMVSDLKQALKEVE